ncbi:hypothetical protein BGW38_001744 [Lunasporangiospora selenospora]|uniref:CRAL-TRIO domain-containing protein n=1 Tax=Lunasporangiospora selenospora TaxID=979761 RepID=A0A9P6G1C3_9FUNG|nr:hypothetical protein BGW38_001744 [Lunasporangiospora selenospora]
MPSATQQPRFTPSPLCRRPVKPAPLTESQVVAVESLREYIHSSPEVKTDLQRRWADEACLIRYLKSRKWNLQEAKQALLDTIQWRDQFAPDVPDKDALWIETKPGKLYISGFDADSRPLLYMKPRNENTAASQNQIRHVVFHLEVAIALMPEGVQTLSIVIDFNGSSMRTSPGAGMAREIIHVLGSHYPERLGHCYFLHAPWFFFPFYKLISPFIDPVTKAKLSFVDMKKQKSRPIVSTPSSASASEVDLAANNDKASSIETSPTETPSNTGSLLDMIPVDMLENEFGGTNDYSYDQESYWSAAVAILAAARSKLEQGPDPIVAPAPENSKA